MCVSDHVLFIRPTTDTGWFPPFVASVAAVNVGVRVSAREPAFTSSGDTQSGFAGSYGSSMFTFLRSNETVFYGSRTVAQSR